MNLINKIQIKVSKMLGIIREKQGNLHLIKRKSIEQINIPTNHIKVGHNTKKDFNTWVNHVEQGAKERFC